MKKRNLPMEPGAMSDFIKSMTEETKGSDQSNRKGAAKDCLLFDS